MKITVKTTQQKVFTIEAEPTDTVAVLKNKIQEAQGHPIASQRIIYSGKVLSDDKLIEDCKFKEKDFLVLMVSKPKPTPAPPVLKTEIPAAASAAESSSTPAEAATTAPSVPAAAESAPAAPATGATPAGSFTDTNSFLSGEALQATITSLTEMGFPRSDVMRAMRASYNNADRAVEYLTMGIPEHLQGVADAPAAGTPGTATTPAAATPAAAPATANPTPAAAPAQPAQPQNLFQLAQQQQQSGGGGGAGGFGVGGLPRAGAGAGAGAGGGLDLAALRDNPQIAQLRELMSQNPGLIQPLIQQMAQSNPEMARAIAENPEALMQLLGVGEGDEGEDVPPGAQVVNVTEEERAAIQRLEALGFPRQAVIQAYFACDKNEELAANFLFENGFED
jgi:UV excision repair protein RAD23